MEVTRELLKPVNPKTEAGTEALAPAEKPAKAERAFQVEDSVEISKEGYIRQQITQDNGKVLTMPKEEGTGKALYRNPKAPAGAAKAPAMDAGDAVALKQTAASIIEGKNISPAAEKALKNANPALYAQAKAKAKARAKAKAKAKEEAQAKAKETAPSREELPAAESGKA